MATRIIQALTLVAIFAGGAACGEPTSTVCTREDEGSACIEPTSAEYNEAADRWTVELRATVTEQVEYTDGGSLCALTRTTCVDLGECNIIGSNIGSAAEAIAECEESFGL